MLVILVIHLVKNLLNNCYGELLTKVRKTKGSHPANALQQHTARAISTNREDTLMPSQNIDN